MEGNVDDINMGSGEDSDCAENINQMQLIRAPRHSKSSGEARPDTLKYYKGTSWISVLENAKLMYRRHIALYHAFPECDTDLGDATKIVAEAMTEFKQDGGILDNGSKFISTLYNSYVYYVFKLIDTIVTWIA